MSEQVDVSAVRRKESRTRTLVLMAIAAVILIAMILDTKVVKKGSEEDARPDVFSAEAYGKREFPRIKNAIEKTAVDATVLVEAITENISNAGKKYGKPGSVGPIFPVKFTGEVVEGKGSIFVVKADDLENITIRLQVGPAINGTEVRDATGTIDFGQFTNQIEYQDAGAALNDEIKNTVLKDLDRENLVGKRINVTGVFQLINLTGWLVTPVSLEIAP